MEAASARAAARDRWGEQGRTPSQLQRFILAACSPENYEPNLALNLEISDLINTKKGTAPREAATEIVNYINHRNPNVALLALNLLDICVKNCGYPFHLQISTKEFLNELVRRFPERPSIRPTRVQAKILEAIEEWRVTICETSRYREDLGFIRDMHRLLSYKGYTFPEVRREDAAVLNPSDNLKSVEEMEEEEREAQSAKLQELIRRGTPHDLQEANRLMKVMAGFDQRSKTDYRAKAAEDVAKIQAKARLLEERLEAFRAGDKMEEGDVFSELASALQSAQPKIQKMCEEESDDHEAVAKLFEINDSIHRTVERYKLMKKGDMEGAAKVAAGGPAPSQTTTVGNAPGELSLIDFDTDLSGVSGGSNGQAGAGAGAGAGASSSSQPRQQPAAGASGLENDLLGLDIGGGSSSSGSFGQGGGIALGFGANQNVPGPALLSSLTDNNMANNNYNSYNNNNNTTPQFPSFGSPSTPQSMTPQQSTSAFAAPSPAPAPAPAPAASDPFAALGISSPSTPSNAINDNNNNNNNNNSSSNSNSYSNSYSYSNSSRSPAVSSSFSPAPPAAAPAAATAGDEDEWNFSSALPPVANDKPREHRSTISSTELRIDMAALRNPSSPNCMSVQFAFSNNTASDVSELHFQLAVTKGYELELQPQTGRSLSPKQTRGITQVVQVWHAGNRASRVESVKLRWRATYKVGGQDRSEMGAVPEFSIA